MKEGYTHIGVVLDRSGSMQSCLSDTIGGFNSFLSSQKEVDGDATITLVQFDDKYEVVCEMTPLKEAEGLNSRTFVPRGSTALLDAIGRTMNDTEHAISEIEEADKPEKVIFVIITDGGENASKEFKRDSIMEMIERHRKEDNWEVVFIGANQDAIKAGGSIGVRAGASYDYDQSSRGTQVMYSCLTQSMSSYRSRSADEAMDADFFTQEDREEQNEIINKKN